MLFAGGPGSLQSKSQLASYPHLDRWFTEEIIKYANGAGLSSDKVLKLQADVTYQYDMNNQYAVITYDGLSGKLSATVKEMHLLGLQDEMDAVHNAHKVLRAFILGAISLMEDIKTTGILMDGVKVQVKDTF